MTNSDHPVLFFAFANVAAAGPGHLRMLEEEARRVRAAFEPAEYCGLCKLEIRYNVTADEVFGVFNRHRGRVALFHYAGHANSFNLLLQDGNGNHRPATAAGLAQFLGQQAGLQLVFLNGCSTRGHLDLLLHHNVPAVLATSHAVRDDVATAFADRFYRAVAVGATFPAAYNEAVGAATASAAGGDVRALFYCADPSPDAVLSAGCPWKWEVRKGAESVNDWTLPDAAGDPLYGLPALPPLDYPESPFQYLNPFGRTHARVFFGRGYEIRELYRKVTDPDLAPVVLLCGESGVGKSSLLDAGLLPRLEADHQVRYLRRQASGLRETLRLALLPELAEADRVGGLPEAQGWRLRENRGGKPVVVMLDQVEGAFTQAGAGRMRELGDLLDAVVAIFGDRANRPKGKLILGFRKEWYSDVSGAFAERKLDRESMFLKRLDRRGVVEAVRLSQSARDRYHLKVEAELEEVIAAELLFDPGSAVAPALQVLLSTLYKEAQNRKCDEPQLTLARYRKLKEQGLHLGNFLNQQLVAIEAALPGESLGLVLDVLAQHTTAMGTATQLSEAELRALYNHNWGATKQVVAAAKEHYLLVRGEAEDAPNAEMTRLAHDTLAELVRSRCEQSDKPEQRSRRILDNRKEEWKDGKSGTPLDENDLTLVLAGELGTRKRDTDEERLVEASLQQRRQREQDNKKRQRNRWLLGIGAILAMIVVAYGSGYIERIQKTEQTAARITADIRGFQLAQSYPPDKEQELKVNQIAVTQHLRTQLQDVLDNHDPTRTNQTALGIANLAAALISIDQTAPQPWRFLEESQLPVRSYLIYRLGQWNANPQTLLDRLAITSDAAVKQGILLALAGVDSKGVNQKTLLNQLGDSTNAVDLLIKVFKTDEDPGVHSAAEHLLWKAGYVKELLAAKKSLRGEKSEHAFLKTWKMDRRGWFINEAGITMIAFPPGQVVPKLKLMDNVPPVENLTVPRPFAIASTEISEALTQAWKEKQLPRVDEDATLGSFSHSVTWNDAAKVCGELTSLSEHVSARQQPPIRFGVEVSPQEIVKSELYRFPTFAEWTLAAGGGSQHRFCYGDAEDLLGEYASRELGDKPDRSVLAAKPNLFGLFDVHGGVGEWCLDWSGDKQDTYLADQDGPANGTKKLVAGNIHQHPSQVVKILRPPLAFEPGCHYEFVGYRVAKTIIRP